MKKKLILGGLITLLTVSLIPFINLFFKEQEKKEIENNVKEVVQEKESKKEGKKQESSTLSFARNLFGATPILQGSFKSFCTLFCICQARSSGRL